MHALASRPYAWARLSIAAALIACGSPGSTSGSTAYAGDVVSGDDAMSATTEPGPPRPEDVPTVEPITLGLAGATEPDVVRYLMVRSAYSPRITPDGERIFYRTSVTGVPQLWSVRVDDPVPEQLTFGEAVTFHSVSPEGEWVLYGNDRGGNEREGYTLMRADGTLERELLAPTEAFRAFGGFSRDGRRIAYATTPEGSDSYDVHVMDLASGVDRLVLRGRLGLYVSAWRPDGGALVLGETRGEDANDLHLLELSEDGEGTLRTLYAPREDPSRYDSIEWTPDSRGFYMISDEGRDFAGVAYVDIASGERRWVHTPDRDVEGLSLSHDGRLLTWTENDGGYSRLVVRDLRTGRDLPLPEGLPRGLYAAGFAERADVMTIAVNGPQIPGDIWVWRVRDRRATRVTRSTLAGLDPSRLVEPTHVELPARDGVTLRGLLYLPRTSTPPSAPLRVAAGSRSGAPPPVVIDVHGGPTAQARPEFSAVQQYLLARGIAVFDFNYRGSTGYGKAFARLDNGRLRPNAVRDLEDALAWLAQDGRVDASRAAVMGGSYGGYMAFAALVTFPTAFRGAVSFVGVSDWVNALEAASPELRASDRLEYGDIEDAEDRAFFRELSPITHIDRIARPCLVSHGANDPRDPVTESDRFVRAARERGVEVDYVRFADEGHGVRRLENRVYLYRRVAAFLERVLR
ncbi:MAG: prolyl oligopeptidase family serine peptidase [Sandaracinaceae bacterium]